MIFQSQASIRGIATPSVGKSVYNHETDERLKSCKESQSAIGRDQRIKTEKSGADKLRYSLANVSFFCHFLLNLFARLCGMTGNNDVYSSDDVLLAFDAPAFVRRALQVEAAWNGLLEHCRRERNRLLELPRIRLARFLKLLDSWPAGSSAICRPDDLAYLEGLNREWKPQLRSRVAPARNAAQITRALAELASSFERFNRRMKKWLYDIDLEPINRIRDGYNRYYLLEKECALRSARLAQQGFVPLEFVRIEDLLERFPLLRVPEVLRA